MKLLATTCVLIWCGCVSCTAQLSPPGPAVALHGVALDEDTLRVHFIDVGGGFGALVETPGGKHVLIDGGKEGGDAFAEYVGHFVENGTVDILIVTHADDDHFFNLAGAIEDFEVGEFWNTGYTSKTLLGLKRWPRFLSETIPGLEAKGMVNWTPLEEFVAPGDWESIDDRGTPGDEDDDVWVQYLNIDKKPPSRDPVSGRRFAESERRNNASLVFKLQYHDTSFLFTGDINGRKKFEDPEDAVDSEEAELLALAAEADDDFIELRATVLQVAHHGSDGSSSLPFLSEVGPEWAVVPAGNPHDHPHAPTMERLRKVIEPDTHILRTDEGPEGDDPTGDDSFVFVVDEDGIREILRIVVGG